MELNHFVFNDPKPFGIQNVPLIFAIIARTLLRRVSEIYHIDSLQNRNMKEGACGNIRCIDPSRVAGTLYGLALGDALLVLYLLLIGMTIWTFLSVWILVTP
jgi:hypothetical protein